ncbi:YkgJ family cysteine cluster protein [Spirochaetota bacterium]
MQPKNKSNLSVCKACKAECCRHVALEIDEPTCKTDYDNIRWYLMHDEIKVFVDSEDEWHIEFPSTCKNLLDDYTCADYEKRPRICRDYPGSGDICEYESDISPYKMVFNSASKFEEYLDNKGIDWRWAKSR